MSRPEVEFAASVVERYAAAKVTPEVQDDARLEVETVASSITIWESQRLERAQRAGACPHWQHFQRVRDVGAP